MWLRWRYPSSVPGDLYDVVFDEPAHTIRLSYDTKFNDDKPKPGLETVTLTYTNPDPKHITLEGRVGDINEVPYSR